ncbi:hypothetical protein Taro_010810 [Colocasia esculenta]|uniref:STAR protein homodimerisation region domain-containing protein n=1 Tax=Colocasia esculenta TaxID=4460 RepID=A0A843U8S5_COLES|nr:hypothetical protein [Colocasia esculenta]
MSGLYTPNFSPARALSPQIRGTADIDSQYLTELLAEYQKLGPFMQVLPICSRLLNQEIMRVSSVVADQGFRDYDRFQYGSPSRMASPNILSNVWGSGLGRWSGVQQEVKSKGFIHCSHSIPYFCSSSCIIFLPLLCLCVCMIENFIGHLICHASTRNIGTRGSCK